MNDRISVIVPVYKVEPYLRKCLDSIVGQTYKELEIILVDDGSPDHCGAICDEYAAKDHRIKVIHKENGGVSSARNAGLAAATGEWIGWVDPDDWIEPDMFEYLLSNAAEHSADIAVCGRVEEYVDHQKLCGWPELQVLDQGAALEQLLEDDSMRSYLCDKLWRKELFQSVRFPIGKTFEDAAVMASLFEKAKWIVCLPEAKYHYRQRISSITSDKRLANKMDHCEAVFTRLREAESKWPRFRRSLELRYQFAAGWVWMVYYDNPPEERKKYLPKMREMARFFRSRHAVPIKASGQGLAGRIAFRLAKYDTWWSFGIAWVVGRLYQAKHGIPM